MSRKRRNDKDEKDLSSRDGSRRGTKNRFNGSSRDTTDNSTNNTDDLDSKRKSGKGTRGRKTQSRDSHVHSANDASWYTKSLEQVNNVANISFMDALGKPFKVWPNASTNNGLHSGAPGVLRIGYIPTFGSPKQGFDPINVAALKTYGYVRYVNSGSRNYDAPDYMKYLAVMDSAFAYAGFLIRAYGLANSYSSVNRYWPEAFFDAMGVDFDSVRTNLAPFRTYINNYISKVNSLAVPDTLPIFNRHFWMCSNVYLDSQQPWAQAIIHVPEAYGVYSYETSDVIFKSLIQLSGQMSVADLEDIGDEIINSIISSQDFFIMSGDTLKAFNSLFKVGGIAEDFMLYPVYDAGVLNQIMSSFSIGQLMRYDSGWQAVDQLKEPVYYLREEVNTGALQLGQYGNNNTFQTHLVARTPQLVTMDQSTRTLLASDWNIVINLASDNVDPVTVLESTRATAVVNYLNYGSDLDHCYVTLESSGADAYTTLSIYYTQENNAGLVSLQKTLDFSSLLVIDGTSLQAWELNQEFQMLLGNFDWHPVLYPISTANDTSPVAQFYFPNVDMYRATYTTKEVISRIHEVANLSLFDVTLTGAKR